MTHPPSALPDPPQSADDPRPAQGGARRARVARGLDQVVEALRTDAELAPRFRHWHEEPERRGATAEWPGRLHPRVRQLLEERGLARPRAHQARAVELALDGHDVLIATPTASGKTLAYTAPVLHSLAESDGAARSLWMFPTKALSQDQSASLNSWIEAMGEDWHSFTYDGDTPPSVRRTLRERGHVVLTNPWMLHAGILPHHAKWAELFRQLTYIVIDEVHTLSGVLGSSVANVLRRLLRVARHYGADPRFLLSSATVAEPARHGRELLGREVRVVDEDSSPSGRRVFGVYDPPLLDPVAGLRASALEEARRLARVVCGPAHQTIFFCNRRTSVEVLTRYLKEAAPRMGLEPAEVRGYRGGYLPDLRREIESGLRAGEVKVVVTTNALELGVDIGALDVAVLVGYPGSQASFWQRVGRVGRRQGSSLALMIARADPVDQFLVSHPSWLFGAARERMALDPDNLVLLSEQLKCASFELPFSRDDAEDPTLGFGDSLHVADVLDYLAEESGFLHRRKDEGGRDTWYWMADSYPASDVSLDGGEIDNVLVFDAETKKAIGEVDRETSITTVHAGAIYQVEGEVWKVERFDYENRRAYARRVDSDYFTEAQTDTEVRVLRLETRRMRARADGAEDYSAWRGEVHVTTLAVMYKKIRFYTRENVGAEDISLPPEELDTEAFVLTLSEESAAELGLHGSERGAAWHGVGELLRRTAPLHLMCDARDLGLSCQVRARHFGRPTLFLYDRVQGGVGLSRRLYEAYPEMLAAALAVIEACSCVRGCPACVGPLASVGPDGKRIARELLGHLVEGGAARAAALDAGAQAAPGQELELDTSSSGARLE